LKAFLKFIQAYLLEMVVDIILDVLGDNAIVALSALNLTLCRRATTKVAVPVTPVNARSRL
jgi:hypothetical protein